MTQAKLENIVLIVLIIVGVGAGIWFRLQGDSQLSAVLLSLAFASILYKFLGGAQEDNSLKLGVIKFGGSAAVLGGFIWLLSQVIFKEEITPIFVGEDLTFRTEPATGWYAADTKTGVPIDLKLEAADTTVQLPLHDVRIDRIKNRRYQLTEFEREHFHILPVGNNEDTLGQVYLSDIVGESISASRRGTLTARDAFVFKLFPHRVGRSSSASVENMLIKRRERETAFPFPFIINTYGTLYSIKKRENLEPILTDQEVLRKNPLVIPEKQADGSTDYWVLYVVHANFLHESESEHYMEWTVVRVGDQK